MAKRKLTARQVRWLFATGRLKASGRGKDRKVTYSKEGGSGKPSKAQRDSTRAQRIAAGNKRLEQFAGRQAAAYKARLAPVGEPHTASRRAFGKYADTGKKYRGGDSGFLIGGSLYERKQRPRIVGQFGGTGAGRRATNAESVNRADAIQRAAARAVAVGAEKQRGRAFINRRDGKSLDASAAGRRSLTASEFKVALKETGAKGMTSPRQAKVASSRAKLAAALRKYRAESPALAREKLLKLKTEPQYKKNLKNPFRVKSPGKG